MSDRVTPAPRTSAWEALAEIRHVKFRSWCSDDGRRQKAGISLWTRIGRSYASFTARQRKNESIEAMVWRAIREVERRRLEGMPKPSERELIHRKHRKLLKEADESRLM